MIATAASTQYFESGYCNSCDTGFKQGCLQTMDTLNKDGMYGMESWIWRGWCCSEAAKTSNINHHHHWPPQQTDQEFDKESARCQDKSTRFHRITVMTWSNAYHCMGEPSKINHSKSKSMQFVAWENVEKWLRNILLLTQSFTRLQSVISI